MKQYIPIIILLAGIVSCTPEKISDKEILDSRTSTKLDVSYSLEGSAVKSLSFTHNAVRAEIEVTVNNENLNWNLESNKSWCAVTSDSRKGSGKVVLEIAANEDFDNREPATLTFVAGTYRGFQLQVNQSASAFIIGKPYFVAPLAGGTYNLTVITKDETSWDISSDDWITAAKGASSSSDGLTTTTLTITPGVNTDDSRYGAVTLKAGNESDQIHIWQFGTDLSYDESGNIYFASGADASLSMTAPAYMIKDVIVPAFASSTVTEKENGTSEVTVTFQENYSDCAEIRKASLSILLNNALGTVIDLPTVIQDYVAANGIVTGKGLTLFAKAVNEGTSTADWERNGVVTVLQDIDMSGISDWTGIGQEERPFSGKFDGGGHSILGLNASTGLFNVTDGAEISGIGMDKSCSIFANNGDILGGIVSSASNTKIENCIFNGSMEYSGKVDESYIGLIAGIADNKTSIRSSKAGGTIKLSSPALSGSTSYTGGISGFNKGTIANCETSGTIAVSSGHTTLNLGGITSSLEEGATVSSNAFLGSITLAGNCQHVRIGGLYGTAPSGSWSFDFSTDKSLVSGTIGIESYATTANVFAGGLVGHLGKDTALSVKGYTVETGFTLDYSSLRTGIYLCAGGILGACEPEEPSGQLVFENITNQGTIRMKILQDVAINVRRNCLGGIAGLVNGPATFTSCTNQADLGLDTVDINSTNKNVNSAKSNSYTMIMGGIAGHCYGGNMTFTGCVNQANLTNRLYTNREAGQAYGEYYSSLVTGGILGGFNYRPAPQNINLTMTNCSSTGIIEGFRGFLGGVAGFAFGATITDCSWIGNSTMTYQASYKGGIVGGLGKATIKDCTVKGDIHAVKAGSAVSGDAGGIVSHVMAGDAVTVEGCSYFGSLEFSKASGDLVGFTGGIVAVGEENTVVKDCRFGGKLQGVDVSTNSVSELTNVIGNGLGSASGITYWNGSI